MGTNGWSGQRALYLASMFLFRFMHPPLLVPWSENKVRRNKGWVFEYVNFTMGHELTTLCGLAGIWRRSCERGPDMVGSVEET
jgi:hypothetical protein